MACFAARRTITSAFSALSRASAVAFSACSREVDAFLLAAIKAHGKAETTSIAAFTAFSVLVLAAAAAVSALSWASAAFLGLPGPFIEGLPLPFFGGMPGLG